MAILKIAKMGHPALLEPAAPVADPTAEEIHVLIEDMIDTMEDAHGAGLAAPQVHVGLRLVIFIAPELGFKGDENREDAEILTILINPEITPLTEDMAEDWEGCLSVPGLRGLVPRYTHIRYKGLLPNGEVLEREARGFHARVVQHECDHLDGILYPQRMTDLSKLVFESEVNRYLNYQKEKTEQEPAS